MTIQNYAAQMGNYTLREEQYQGRTHIVAPVVLMVEGVHNGSQGAVLYTAEELGRFAGAWNGRPVPVGHPKDADGFISCNEPDVLEKQVVGQVFNAKFMDGKLKGEIWVDKAKASTISPLALAHLLSGVSMDVSIGVFNDEMAATGIWKGEDYTAIARNIRPDHLALLPGGEGACSWKDGCGVRANQGGERVKRTKLPGDTEPGPNEDVVKARELISAGWFVTMAKPGFKEAMGQIQSHLNGLDSPTTYHYLEEMFPGHFVYEVFGADTVTRYYKQAYSFTNSKLTLGDGAVEVRKDVKYLDINTNEKTNDGGQTVMKVDELIANKATLFTEGDREWLTALSDCERAKLVPVVVAAKVEPAPVVNAVKKEDPPAVFGKDEAIAVIKEQLSTKEQFLDLMPTELRDQFETGFALNEVNRAKLIEQITGYTKAYSEDELKGKPTDELTKLVGMIPAKQNFSGLGNNTITTSEALPKLLPSFLTEKKEGGKS